MDQALSSLTSDLQVHCSDFFTNRTNHNSKNKTKIEVYFPVLFTSRHVAKIITQVDRF